MNLLFPMSLAGSLVFLVYLCIRPLTLRYFPAAWRYRFLKVTLLFYLAPYQYYKLRYQEIISEIFPPLQQKFYTQTIEPVWDMSRFIIIDPEGHRHFKNQMIYLVILAAWMTIAFGFIFIQVKKYRQCKRAIQKITVPASALFNKANEFNKNTGFRRRGIQVYSGSHIKEPFVIGIFRPRVILPEVMAEDDCLDMVLIHELEHIRNHDGFIKVLGVAAIILHWYNPLVYFLYREMGRTSEHVCDEAAVRGRSDQEKEDYQMLLLKTGNENQIRSPLSNALSGEFKLLKERIIVMEKKVVSSKKRTIISVGLTILLFALSPLSVWAYTPVPIFEDKVANSGIDNDTVLFYRDEEWNRPDFIYNDDPFLESGTKGEIFIDSEGVIHILSDMAAQNSKETCSHQWKQGIIYKHLLNGAGGCSVYSYEAQVCTKCSLSRNVVLANILQYLNCPHGDT